MFVTIKRILFILNKSQKRGVLFMGILILIGGMLETLGVSLILPLANAILDTEALAKQSYVVWVMNVFRLTDMREFVIVLLLGTIFVFIGKNAFLLLQIYVQSRFINKNQAITVSYMLEEYLNRPYEYYLNADIPTIFRTVDSDVPKVFMVLMELTQLGTEVFVSVCLCVFLFFVDPIMLSLVGTILFGMTFIIMKVMKPKLNQLGGCSQAIQSQMGKWRLQSVYGIKDVKVLNKESFFASSFRKYAKIGAGYTSKYNVLNSTPRLLIETMCIVGVFSYLIIFLVAGKELQELVPQITAFAVAAMRLLPSVNRINSHVTNLAYMEPAIEYVYYNVDFTNFKKYGRYQREEAKDPTPLKAEGEIRLENITYAYPNTTKNILDGANMNIPVGKSVGVMGPSGAGKTTAVDLILGLLAPQGGRITCNGRDVQENYESWLSHIGYIPQAIFLTDDSIRENIAFGVAKEDIDENRIWAVLEEAQMKEFVQELPEGLDTTIGDRGVRISGGQRQRLGIARALYHNPEILVFDEATSALDNDTETAIMEAIDKFHGRKTLIIIAHRLRTIESCDLIYRVADGKAELTTL